MSKIMIIDKKGQAERAAKIVKAFGHDTVYPIDKPSYTHYLENLFNQYLNEQPDLVLIGRSQLHSEKMIKKIREEGRDHGKSVPIFILYNTITAPDYMLLNANEIIHRSRLEEKLTGLIRDYLGAN